MMSPIQPWYSNASLWCNDSSGVAFANNQVPRQLTPGLFLICGDCAWAGLPSNMMGGPCTIRHLTMLAPNFSMVADMTCSLHRGRRVTRSLAIGHMPFIPLTKNTKTTWNFGERDREWLLQYLLLLLLQQKHWLCLISWDASLLKTLMRLQKL